MPLPIEAFILKR